MKVLLFNGSPHRGNTWKLTESCQPAFFVFPEEKAALMRQGLIQALELKRRDQYLSFAQSMIGILSYGPVKRFDERIEKVLSLFEGEGKEDEALTLKDLSQGVSLSQSRLAHLFMEETGIPLKSYTVIRKLKKAYDALFNGDNITMAALNAGFNSPSHFAYTNKLMTGMSASGILKDSEFLKAF